MNPSILTTCNQTNSLRHAGSELDTDSPVNLTCHFVLVCRLFKTTCQASVVSSSPTQSLMFRRQIVSLFCLRTPILSPFPPEIEPLSGSSQRPPCSLYTVTQLLGRHTSFVARLPLALTFSAVTSVIVNAAINTPVSRQTLLDLSCKLEGQ